MHRLGKDGTYREIDSPHGHDAFLKEWDQMTAAIGAICPTTSRRRTMSDDSL